MWSLLRSQRSSRKFAPKTYGHYFRTSQSTMTFCPVAGNTFTEGAWLLPDKWTTTIDNKKDCTGQGSPPPPPPANLLRRPSQSGCKGQPNIRVSKCVPFSLRSIRAMGTTFFFGWTSTNKP